MNRVLSTEDDARLAELEAIISAGVRSFIEVGLAIQEVQSRRLYLKTHRSFQSYMEERFGFTRQHGYRLIAGAKAAKEVSHYVTLPSASHAEPLVILPKKERVKVARVIAKKAKAGDPITVRAVKEAVKEVTTRARGGLAASLAEAKSAGIVKNRVQVTCPHCKGKGLVWEDEE